MNKRSVTSWVFYDWANSAFATTIMSGFFPIFFKNFSNAGVAATESTFRLSMANTIASMVVFVLGPILGTIADRCSNKKKFLLFFAFIGCSMSAGLYFAGRGEWLFAFLLYVMATLGFSGGNLFYDAMLVFVAKEEKYDFVSSLGFSLGYLGGGLLFAINVFMTIKPELFGLVDASHAVRVSFLTVGIWWAVFSIPIFLFVQEEKTPGSRALSWLVVRESFVQLRQTIQKIVSLKMTLIFLLAYLFYIDGVGTIIKMVVDYGLALGFDQKDLISALLLVQAVGFPATMAYGKLGEKIGAKNGILLAVLMYAVITIWGVFLKSRIEIYLIAALIGLVQGGLQALSRSLYARMIPPTMVGEFFGFYNMIGKFAAIFGPLIYGYITLETGSNRIGMFSIILLFLAGGGLLFLVNVERGAKDARAFKTQAVI